MTTQNPQSPTALRLFELLPMVHRLRDDAHGAVLRELMDVLAEQVDVLTEEISARYDDQFIETCAPWAVPYVADLVGYRPRHTQAPTVPSQRAEAANTIGYRRRKGTVTVLEQLAHDVTGWPARAVEFFERVLTTQYVNHPRPHAALTPDLRAHERLAWVTRMNGAFDDYPHSADVRRIDAPAPATPGRHNIGNIGIFLWRTEAIPVTRAPLRPHTDGDTQRFRFDPLGADLPLFTQPRTEDEITHVATPREVPLPLTVRYLSDHLGALYGAGRAVLLERRSGSGAGAVNTPIALADIRVSDLSDDPGTGDWAHPPAANLVALDPEHGRVYLGSALAAGERLVGNFSLGHAVPVGAGAAVRGPVTELEPVVPAADGQGLQARLNSVATGGTVRIVDSDRYQQTLAVKAVAAPAGAPATTVQLVAGEGCQPLLAVPLALRLQMDAGTTVVLDGLTVAGGPVVLEEVGDAAARTVIVRNCTLVPGALRTQDRQPVHPDRASLIVLDPYATVRLERCVTGPIVAVAGSRIELHDCAVDAGERAAVAVCGREPVPAGLRTVGGASDVVVGTGESGAGELDLHECTVIGGIHCTQLDASNSILLAQLASGDPRPVAVHARRRQVGCVRYSYLPEESRVGKRYRCVPNPEDPPAMRAATAPKFTSLTFGDPAYLQLSTATTAAVRVGADDESEMGVTHQLFTPQREANLALRLDEYLRFGLRAGFCYAT